MKFAVQTIGSRQHQELWVPAEELEELEEFNANIVGAIDIVEHYEGEKLTIKIDPATHLPIAWRAKRRPDVIAEVRFLATEDGGRHKPASNNYRPAHLVLPDYLTTGVHEYIDRDVVLPGETVRTFITFVSPDAYPRSLWVGKTINVQEGSRVIGHATILRILNPVLLGETS